MNFFLIKPEIFSTENLFHQNLHFLKW